MNKNKAIKKCQKMQKLHDNILKDTKKIRKTTKKMKKYRKKIDKLSSFYYGEWMKYVDLLKNEKDVHFSILNQDSIYEALEVQYKEVKKLLNSCSLYILK